MLQTEPEIYLIRMEQLLGRSLTSEDREHFLSQDAEVRIAGLSSLVGSPVLTDEELASISTPCLIFCSDLEPFYAGALAGARHMHRVGYLSFPGLDHINTFACSNLVVQHIKEFLVRVSKM